ncbi:MAG TPA: serine/threonine-protein kinase [Kofleriaceae bacterium]|jgi:serine/threonine-protein kinase
MPTQVGRYELVQLLATGGMADIYLARQTDLDRRVAVKVLAPHRNADPEARVLFDDEARVLSMLSHANLATVYEVASVGGMQYVAMELVEGVDLRVLVQETTRLEAPVAAAIVRAAAAGLDHAHRRCDADGRPLHLVHRDVSLSNIMVTYDGSVKVVDFGIARSALSVHTTSPGIVRGKAAYMSPEQALGEAVDLRTDVFALGIVLYELTTGRRCFAGASDFERMISIVRGEYVSPTVVVPGYSPGLAKIIATCLAVDAGKRYSSAAALVEAIDQLAHAEGWAQGTPAIAALMRATYGDSPTPLPHTAEVTASSIVDEKPSPCAAPHATVRLTRRRLAKGTCSDTDDTGSDDDPTRGRRSVPRMFRSAA